MFPFVSMLHGVPSERVVDTFTTTIATIIDIKITALVFAMNVCVLYYHMQPRPGPPPQHSRKHPTALAVQGIKAVSNRCGSARSPDLLIERATPSNLFRLRGTRPPTPIVAPSPRSTALTLTLPSPRSAPFIPGSVQTLAPATPQ